MTKHGELEAYSLHSVDLAKIFDYKFFNDVSFTSISFSHKY